MTTVNLFEYASRKKLRYDTAKGQLSAEQLWELPLTHDNPAVTTLDSVARSVHRELRSVTEESFVQLRKGDREAHLTLKLELVKHIIGVKLAEREQAERARALQQEKRQGRQRCISSV
ncbi:hypothetical protein [Deinococcus hopiensis]|uniref:Uncharacterized protein n=1 Tax=Deinococcus hopiensis KR-140 TaxID=695939 RepID=A0A1W1UT87_9DEIO|nr:hypothetical protein [Deinococcus hopiensis]SMB84266.1 hypothetical protein SAMN00790413_05057 [Deinococcus hopiensis KR-140]